MRILTSLAIGALLISAGSALAQAPADGIPITQLIATVSKKTSKKFVVDPRVQAQVTLVGQDPASVTYNDLLTILQLHGFAAVESAGYVRVVPDAGIRATAVPLVTGRETQPGSQYVSRVITVKTMPAVMLVPLLRPLVPQNGHLAAIPCKNVLMMVDTYDNVKRMETLLDSVDTGPAYTPEKCERSSGVSSKSD